MQFSFLVGIQEPHQIDFSFDQFRGNLEIRVDDQPLVKDLRILSLKLTKRYEFTVGTQEQHHIAIEKQRKLFLAKANAGCETSTEQTQLGDVVFATIFICLWIASLRLASRSKLIPLTRRRTIPS